MASSSSKLPLFQAFIRAKDPSPEGSSSNGGQCVGCSSLLWCTEKSGGASPEGLISSVSPTGWCWLAMLLLAMPVGLHDHQMIGCCHHMAAESPAPATRLLQAINDHDLGWAFIIGLSFGETMFACTNMVCLVCKCCLWEQSE